MIKSGLLYPFGIGFWGPNGHDGIWHIALSESIAQGSWQLPIFPPYEVENYHIGFDLVLAILHKLTFLPISVLYFQIIPLLIAFLIGTALFLFLSSWEKTQSEIVWALFFLYFGGSLGWIITFFRNGEFGGESMFWSQQSISTLINPPFALSLLLLFLGLYFLKSGLDKKRKTSLIIATFLFGILIQVKAYAGVLALLGLGISGITALFQRRGSTLFKVFSGALIVSLLLFLPKNANSSSIFVFQPFWFLETMMGYSDRLNWQQFYSAMTNYRLGNDYLRITFFYGIAFCIFIVGNFSLRICGVFHFFKKRFHIRSIEWISIFFLVVITLGIGIPLFFVQDGTPWNTIQFFYYSLIFTGILGGIVLGKFLEKRKKVLRYIFSILIILLTLPTTFSTLAFVYLPERPPAMVSFYEVDALTFLRSQPEGIVLTYPYDKYRAEAAISNPPRPLYLYESTAYVSAYSGKSVFLEDEVNLAIMNYDWQTRREEVLTFFSSNDQISRQAFLHNAEIQYIYLVGFQRDVAKTGALEPIFENEEVTIYKTN